MASLITQAMTSNTTPAPYVASASSSGPGAEPFKAFDKQPTATAWASATGTGGSPSWLRIDLGTAQTASTYSITSMPAGYLDRNPSAWTLQGSNDTVAWTTLDTRSGVTGWSASSAITFTPATTGSFRYYRLNITANGGNQSSTQVAEWDLQGADSVPQGSLVGTLSKLAGSFTATHTPPPPEGTLDGTLPALTGSFQADAPVSGPLVGTLSPLEGSFTASSGAAIDTSTQYANLSGYNYHGEGEVDYDPPVAPSPARIRPAPIQRVHQSLPVPTLVNGRPT